MISKEEMALEALLKLMTELSEKGSTVNQSALDYATKAINANGWAIGINSFGLCKPVKIINAQTPN